MSITIIFMAVVVAMAVSDIILTLRRRKTKQLYAQQFTIYTSDFSAAEYMERMEKASIDIQREKEEQPKQHLILWLVLDGLRLNEDGTSEWIRRGDEKKAQPQTDELRGFNDIAKLYDGPMTMQASILQSQMQTLIFQQQQAAQAAMLINAIRPQYPYYQPYYQQQLQQTCCSPYIQCQPLQGGMF